MHSLRVPALTSGRRDRRKINDVGANILRELEVSRVHQTHGGAYRRVR